jgi:hypothetical protein
MREDAPLKGRGAISKTQNSEIIILVFMIREKRAQVNSLMGSQLFFAF